MNINLTSRKGCLAHINFIQKYVIKDTLNTNNAMATTCLLQSIHFKFA